MEMTNPSMAEWKKWDFDGGDKWSNWEDLSPQLIEKLKNEPGAYVLGLPETEKRKKLPRLLASDEHQIIDIGESRHLQNRIRDLLRCAQNEGHSGHMAGWRLGSGGLLRRLNLEAKDLRVSFCYAKDKHDAYRIEGTMLRRYYELFGELPPLNYKFNWSAWEDT